MKLVVKVHRVLLYPALFLGAIVVQNQDAVAARGTRHCVGHMAGKNGKSDFEGLDGAVKVLVIDGVFIMVHPGIWSCHLVTNAENAVISWIRFDPRLRLLRSKP